MPRQEIGPSRDQICEKRSDLLWKDYENEIVTLAKHPEKNPSQPPPRSNQLTTPEMQRKNEGRQQQDQGHRLDQKSVNGQPLGTWKSRKNAAHPHPCNDH